MRPVVRAILVPTVALSLALGALDACGGAASSSPPVLAPAASARAQAAAPAPPAPLPEHTLPRSAVHEVVSQGLGAFLQRIELEDQPVRASGKFRGFRVAQLRGAQFWSGVDLKPGDVITAINGLPIERPEQAQTVFDSLEVVSELHVAYERDGQPRELSYAIADDR